MATVAEILYETLNLSGVKRVYGLPGDSLNGFTDSIGKHNNIRWIHVRHEEAASFAAGAGAHLTNRLCILNTLRGLLMKSPRTTLSSQLTWVRPVSGLHAISISMACVD